VIDSGYHYGMEYIPLLRMQGMWQSAAPQSRIQQRRGRVGRKFPGVFYPLYPKNIWEKCDKLQKPNIQIEDISSIFIDIIKQQYAIKYHEGNHDPLFNIADINMLTLPSPDALLSSTEKFYSLGFIVFSPPKYHPSLDDMVIEYTSNLAVSTIQQTIHQTIQQSEKSQSIGLSILGMMYSVITNEKLTPECVRMILAGYAWKVDILDLITIAAYLCMDQSLLKGQKPIDWYLVYKSGLPGFLLSEDILLKAKVLFMDEFIEGILIYNALSNLSKHDNLSDVYKSIISWSGATNIDYRGIIEFIAVRDSIIEQFITNKFALSKGFRIWDSTIDNFMDTIARIKYCIYDGFRLNLLIKQQDATYRTLNGMHVDTPKIMKKTDIKRENIKEYDDILKALPEYLIYKSLTLSSDHKGGYLIKTDKISMLDGFVVPDLGGHSTSQKPLT
jgi:hypothetical protein